MKLTIALVALFLVCGAQARSVEVYAKEQLKKFVHRLEAEVKPALIETYHEVEQIKSDMENATNEAYKFLRYRDQDATFSTQPIKSDIVETLAKKMKLDRPDEINCELKSLSEMFELGSSIMTLNQCIEDNSTKFLEPVAWALKELNFKVFLIDYNIERAKKCADDATSTPSSATKCLNEVEFVVDKGLKRIDIFADSSFLKNEYNEFLKKLEECKSLTNFEDLIARLSLAANNSMNCTIELLKEKGLSVNLSDL